MIYRTSQRGTYRNINQSLNLLSYRIGQLTSQVASERRINRPSDDPSGAATVLRTRSVISDIYQYKENIAVSDLWLTDSGAAAQSIKTTLDDIYEQAEQGATDTYNEPQRSAIIAGQIDELFQSLIASGNSKIGDTYIFGGQKVSNSPFSLLVEAQKVVAGCNNSAKWTGQVVNYGKSTFNNRPDLPIHSQKFLVEVVQAGGIDSDSYTNTTGLSLLKLTGADYTLRLDALNPAYNNTQIRLVPGPANNTTTGSVADDNGITFSGGPSPVNVIYQLGNSAATTGSWSAATNTYYVALQTNSAGTASVATANDVAAAVGPPLTAALTAGVTGAGVVGVGSISYNWETTPVLNGDEITVYLRQNTDVLGGGLAATADEVMNALNGHPVIGGMMQATVIGNGLSTMTPVTNFAQLQPGEPYTLARTTMDPVGTQNALTFSITNNSPAVGEVGNNYGVRYAVSFPLNTSASVVWDPATTTLTVNLATSSSIYADTYVKVYNDRANPAYQSASLSHNIALKEATLTTANDVIAMVNAESALSFIRVDLADGNSGLGRVTAMDRAAFADGYEQAAMFRVSQDGGKTWGPPMSFAASEFMTGDMFYNSMLGHASLTTGFPGQGNDLVFTANHMGTWGNDVRVEYKTAGANAPLDVCAGPNPWNICVYLATDDQGQPISTANDVMNAINNNSSASQWVTADLANYHEGGHGIVGRMDLTSLSVGEPYQIDGRTQITPLGHATATVEFPYSPPGQANPNIDFQALTRGTTGNDIGIRYTTSADPTFYTSAGLASDSYQGFTSVRYEEVSGKTVVVVHLATTTLPSCPDPNIDYEASEDWKELWPLYSCTSSRAVITTAGSVIQAVIDKNMENPASAVIWASLEQWPDGWEGTAKVGPTNGTIWLTGGNETDNAANHGVNLRFMADGTALQLGDVFEVPVGWYRGDEKELNVNVNNGYRTQMNMTGVDLYGATGADDNILDTVQRLSWALKQNDTELVGKELVKVREAIEKVTTMESTLGTQLIRNEFVTNSLSDSLYNAQDLLSNVEDIDFAQLITDLKNAQTVYEACLGVTGMTTRLGLLSYL